MSVFNSPALSLKTLVRVIGGFLSYCFEYVQQHWLVFLAATLGFITFFTVPLPEVLDQQRVFIKEFAFFALYWILLGIASSVGLGTGLHTFILYLGPHIAQVVMAANECNRVPEMLPSRWKFDHFAKCQSVPES